MLNISKDESIYSAIFRTHIINDVGDFSNIITANGKWSSFPKILEGTLHNYGLVDDFQFLILLRDIGLAPVTNKMFDNPVKYRKHLEQFFGIGVGHKNRLRYSYQIKYCLSCIKEHIKEFGHGIFKVTWLKNNHCAVHNTPLYFSTESSRAGGVKALKNILRGEHPKNHSTTNEISNYFFDFRKHSYSTTVDHFTPCLKDKLYKFIMEKHRAFPESTFDQHCYIGRWRTL